MTSRTNVKGEIFYYSKPGAYMKICIATTKGKTPSTLMTWNFAIRNGGVLVRFDGLLPTVVDQVLIYYITAGACLP